MRGTIRLRGYQLRIGGKTNPKQRVTLRGEKEKNGEHQEGREGKGKDDSENVNKSY